MRQWSVMYRKEMLEMWRSGKWLWVPIVFVILGVMNPVTSYYMPQILEAAGNMPEGTVISIPKPEAPMVMGEVLSQLNTLGLLILVLASMGVVSAERNSGISAMILVKPVHYGAYISAKWAGLLTLAGVSFLASYMSAWYYTEILIGTTELGRVLQSFVIYLLWLAFIMSLTLLMSTWLKGNGAVAFVTLFAAAALSLLSGLFSRFFAWSPGRLSAHAQSYLQDGQSLPHFPLAVGISLALIIVMLVASIKVLQRQEFPE